MNNSYCGLLKRIAAINDEIGGPKNNAISALNKEMNNPIMACILASD